MSFPQTVDSYQTRQIIVINSREEEEVFQLPD